MRPKGRIRDSLTTSNCSAWLKHLQRLLNQVARVWRPDLAVEHAARVWGCPWAKACVQRCTPEYLQNLKAGFAARANKIKEDKARSEEEAAALEAPGGIAEAPSEMTE